MGKHRSDDLKKAVVDFYFRMSKKSLEKTAQTFQVPEETVRRWVARYEEDGNVKYKYRGSMSYKVEQTHFDFIKAYVTNKKDVYIRELRYALREKFKGFDISLMHLSRVVQDIPYSQKKWTDKHYPKERYGKPLNYEEDKAEFFRRLKKHKIDDIIALDETNIQIGMKRGKARCYIGQRCIKHTDDNSIFQRFSLLVAISSEKVEGWLLKKGAVRHEDLKPFLENLLAKEKKRKLIVIDNAPSHKRGIDKHVEQLGHELLYILPYQHRMNPIEQFFNQLKHYMRDKVPMNEKEVREAIDYAIKKIDKTHLTNYFLNAYDPKNLDKPRNKIIRQPKKKYKDEAE